jgi:hypothetical protein
MNASHQRGSPQDPFEIIRGEAWSRRCEKSVRELRVMPFMESHNVSFERSRKNCAAAETET